MGWAHLGVCKCVPLFRISGSAGRIAVKFIVWEGNWLLYGKVVVLPMPFIHATIGVYASAGVHPFPIFGQPLDASS